jgi:hypothetical protein
MNRKPNSRLRKAMVMLPAALLDLDKEGGKLGDAIQSSNS